MLYDPNNTQPPGSDSGSPPPDQPPSQPLAILTMVRTSTRTNTSRNKTVIPIISNVDPGVINLYSDY